MNSDNTVHYYGVRKNDKLIVGNGYSYNGGLGKYSIGMGVQKEYSHGLCQIYQY